jgi:hypothetical protein
MIPIYYLRNMKKLILGLFASFLLAAFVNPAKAQISVNFNIGNWTPPPAYSDVKYYYLPDVESYYYAPKKQFVYKEDNQWVFRNTLPAKYSNYRLDNGYKVAVNRPKAYTYFETDRTRYARYKGSSKKTVIRGNSYNAHTRVVNKTKYVKIKGNNGNNGKGHGGGNGKGHGKH